MPQQVLASPKAPETQPEQRAQGPQRERELRVQGDAGAFGMLLGALQAGDAGIVRGEPRDDSAAEWNARTSREDRQTQREPAQLVTPKAQETRDAPLRAATTNVASDPSSSPAASAQAERVEATRQPSVPVKSTQPAGGLVQQADASAEVRPAQQVENTAARAPQPSAAIVASASVARASAGSASSANPTSQISGVASSRGPQGGAARGSAPSQQTGAAERNLRFERIFEGQLNRGLAKALQSGDGSVTLRLKPESLGQLQVRVSIEQQQVRATFEAQTIEAKRMLDGSKESLRNQLEARGLSVERIEIRLVDDQHESGTRIAKADSGGASTGQDGQDGQDGRMSAQDRGGRGSTDRGGAHESERGGAPQRDDEPNAVAEPWRALGTVRLDAIA